MSMCESSRECQATRYGYAELEKKLSDSKATEASAILAVTDYKERWVRAEKKLSGLKSGNYVEGPGTSTDKPHPMVPIWKLEKRLAEAEAVVAAVRELMYDRTTRENFSFVLVGKVGDALVAYDKSAQKDRPTLKKRPDQCLAENPTGLMCHLTKEHDGPHEGMGQGHGAFSDYL